MTDKKKAKWPLSERAAHIEQGKWHQYSQGKAGDIRKQTQRDVGENLKKDK